MHAALNSLINSYDIILFQEPWWNLINNTVYSSVSNTVWQQITPTQPVSAECIPRVITYYKDCEDFSVVLRSDLAKDLDFQVLEVLQAPHPPVLITNIYNQKPGQEEVDEWTSDRLVNLDFDPEHLEPLPDQFDWPPITVTEVHEALFHQAPKKAPGPDGIPFQVLRWLWIVASDQIYHLIATCTNVGYHPRKWRESISITLRKLHKPDYSQLHAYCLIALLPCISKILERVQARQISHLGAKYHLVSPNQFGSVPGRSTEDAILYS
jgi:hypothetical protein